MGRYCMKTSRKIEWRVPTLGEYVEWTRGYPDDKPIPTAVWVKSVDGVAHDELDVATLIDIIPLVTDFLAERRDRLNGLHDSVNDTSDSGSNSSESEGSTTKGSTKT